jgi:hypothetical protein
MAIRNNDWYNLNEQRDYPVDDKASTLDDSGNRLPSALITDMRLRWPESLGQYAYVSAASVTPSIVTVMIEVSQTLDNVPNTSTLIAGVSIPVNELTQGRTYVLETFSANVAGFITLGSGAETSFVGRFSTPNQTLLTPRAARSLKEPPISSAKILQSDKKLSGLVNLSAVSPLQVSKETRVIEGVEYDNVIVVRLTEPAGAAATTSVYSEFAGDCGRRVGSKTCVDPQPIETINGILPDCDGVITLEFVGCAVVGKNVTDCGVIVDCSLGLSASCDPPHLPDLETGKLPSELEPIVFPPTIPPEPPIIEDSSLSESVNTVLSLPYCDPFDEGIAYGFSSLGNSLFGFIADDSPEEEYCCVGAQGLPGDACAVSQSISVSFSNSYSWDVEPVIEVDSSYGAVSQEAQAVTNISAFTSDVQCLFRKYTTDCKITAGASGAMRNAGIMLNYRLTDIGIPQYYVAILDLDTSTFGIYYFNGAVLSVVNVITIIDVRQDDWYRVTLSAVPDATTLTSVNLTATLNGITDPTISATLVSPVSSGRFGADSGLAGLYTRRSRAYFSFWRIDEVSS